MELRPPMSASPFLQVPIRLQHEAPEIFERLAEIGMLCVRAKNLTGELVAIADPAGLAMESGDSLLFPGLGLSMMRERVAGLHALRMASLPQNPGILELDFTQGRFPLAFALPDELADGARLREFVADFCVEEVEIMELLRWRDALTAPVEACPCCKAAAAERRARPDLHPLAPILADLVELQLPMHCRIRGDGFDFSRFIEPRRLSFDGGAITLNDDSGECVLRVDPAQAHALWVLPLCSDGETRSSVRIYDTFGSMNLEFSVPDDRFVRPWQGYCRTACP